MPGHRKTRPMAKKPRNNARPKVRRQAKAKRLRR